MNTDKNYAEMIASEYAPKETSKIVALKKLDKKAKRGPTAFAYVLGTICALVLGVGMCFSLGTLGDGSKLFMALGAAIGALGIVGAAVNLPVYKKLLEKSKARYGNDIIELAKQIVDED